MSKLYNLIYLFDKKGENVLLMLRTKAPFLGLLNGVGGKVELGESILHSCYRELCEETGYTVRQHTELTPVRVRFHADDIIEVYTARLLGSAPPALEPEQLDLRWININNALNSLDERMFAPSVQRDLLYAQSILWPKQYALPLQ